MLEVKILTEEYKEAFDAAVTRFSRGRGANLKGPSGAGRSG